MSTRAQIAFETGPEEWSHVYVHFDGYPEHMLPALAHWSPEDILAARELRQVLPAALDRFDPPRMPRKFRSPTCEFDHLYLWRDGQWIELEPLRR